MRTIRRDKFEFLIGRVGRYHTAIPGITAFCEDCQKMLRFGMISQAGRRKLRSYTKDCFSGTSFYNDD